MLVSLASSCWTPKVQLRTFGATASRMREEVSARASACVFGVMNGDKPPPCKKPCPPFPARKSAHHDVAGAIRHVRPALFSNCRWGGWLLVWKLVGLTSEKYPAPPRTDHLPLPVGSHANPMRGAKLFVSGFGAVKNSPIAGSLEMALKACVVASRGTPKYS